MTGTLSTFDIDDISDQLGTIPLDYGRFAYDPDRKLLVTSSTEANAINVLDMADPENPTVLGTLTSSPHTYGITAMMYSYYSVTVASSVGQSITTINTVNPAAPYVSHSIVDGALVDVIAMTHMSGGYIVVASKNDSSIQTVSPAGVVASLTDDTNKFDDMVGMERHGLYLVVIGKEEGVLTVLDASDPTNLRLVGSTSASILEHATDFKIDGDYVAVAVSFGGGGIAMFSLVDLTEPYYLDYYSNPDLVGTNPRLLVFDGFYYVVNGVDGLMTKFDFRSDTQVHFDQHKFDFDGIWDTDSRICLEFYGPATVLALTYQVDDTDNPPNNGR